MISILFFIKRHRLLRTGQAPIYVRVSANRAYSEFGIGRGVDQEQWVTARGRVKP
ncbi:Arm DNA-binding domain-containing protein, partial [uncultured Alistipes sp.]